MIRKELSLLLVTGFQNLSRTSLSDANFLWPFAYACFLPSMHARSGRAAWSETGQGGNVPGALGPQLGLDSLSNPHSPECWPALHPREY